MSRRVSFISPEAPMMYPKDGGPSKVGGNKKKMMKVWIFKLPKVGGFLRQMGAKVAKAAMLSSNRRRCSTKVSSAASLSRSRSYAAETLDSQRAQAIEDCIQFFNSSSSSSFSSLQRSNSVTSSC